jgi:hypothetical protein
MERSNQRSTILDTAVASWILRALSEELTRRLSHPADRRRYLEGDESVEGEALAVACARIGVWPRHYWMTLEVDALLFDLHRAALIETVAGTPDPGPYDRISRESPSGNEGNRHFNGWMLRGNSP